MDRFVSTFTNKIDAKGRVSIPASFRAVLERDGYAGGIYCYPSLDSAALDAGGERLAKKIDGLLAGLPDYSDERDELSVALYGDVQVLAIDGDGPFSIYTTALVTFMRQPGLDMEQIFKAVSDNARLSKWAGGLGNDWTNIRATGSLIKTVNITSQGVIPFLKIANDVTVAIARSGRRIGATCVYLENWHMDFPEFLELRFTCPRLQARGSDSPLKSPACMRWVSKRNAGPHMGVPSRFGPHGPNPGISRAGGQARRAALAPAAFVWWTS